MWIINISLLLNQQYNKINWYQVIKINQNKFQIYRILYLSVNRIIHMNNSQDFITSLDEEDKQQWNQETFLVNVKKFISQPIPLMSKIQFSSYLPQSHFPLPISQLPATLTANAIYTDLNNMNLIQESSFRHQKLKQDVIKLLTARDTNNEHLSSLPTLKEYYGFKQPFYQRYPPQPHQSSYFATFIMDITTSQKNQKSQAVPNTHTTRRSQTQTLRNTYRSKIIFDSHFESGNLFQVYQKQADEFDLILQNDINTKGNNQWFFFSVKNVPKGTTLTFNIINFNKKSSLFQEGMKPTIFSIIRYEKRKIGWVRQGLRLNYSENTTVRRQNGRPYYVFSFSYKFIYDGDVVYFSHSYPYTLSNLSNYLKQKLSAKESQNKIKFKKLGQTLGGNQVDFIQISNESYQKNSDKKVIWIFGRQHPGQVTSSFMIEGIINYLLSKTQYVQFLLKYYVFKIVPMINVDGVVHGNTRAELIGCDPNRRWNCPDKIYNPIIYALKKQIQKDQKRVEMIFDLHSHSRKFGTFFYGNISSYSNPSQTKVLPLMVSKNDSRFNFQECRFGLGSNKTARRVLFERLNIPLIYTIQSSFYGYQKNDHNIITYFPDDYRQMGRSFLQTLASYSAQKMNVTMESKIICQIENIQQQIEETIKSDLSLNIKPNSLNSDSQAEQDQFSHKQLRNLLPKTFNIQKKHKKVVSRSRRTNVIKKVEKQETQQTKRVQKIQKLQKQSYYKQYFSCKGPSTQYNFYKKKTNNQIYIKQTINQGIQVDIEDCNILQPTSNGSHPDRKFGLCILGKKFEQDIIFFGNNVGVQAQLNKQFTKNRYECSSLNRKKIKIQCRPSSIMQIKQNNFLNRGLNSNPFNYRLK